METPTLVSAVNTENGIAIKWNSVEHAGKYAVFRKTAGERNWPSIATVETVEYLDTTAESGSKYIYTVKAIHGVTVSGCDADGLTVVRLTVPHLTDAVQRKDGVLVAWEAVAGAEQYVIFRKLPGNNWITLDRTRNTDYLDLTAEKDRVYIYTVKALCGNSVSYCEPDGIAVSVR